MKPEDKILRDYANRQGFDSWLDFRFKHSAELILSVDVPNMLKDLVEKISELEDKISSQNKAILKTLCEKGELARDNFQLKERAEKAQKQLAEGRSYLMEVVPDDITVQDSLEAFGFGRDGVNLP